MSVTAEAAAAQASDAAARAGRAALITEAGWFQALVHQARGRPEDAEAVALTTYDLYRRTRNLNAETILSGVLIGVRADQGRVEELRDLAKLALSGPFALVYRACLSQAAGEAGLLDVARSTVLSPADLGRVPADYFMRATLVSTAHTWWHLGIHADAAEVIAGALRPVSTRLAFPGSTAPFVGPIALALARLAALVGDDAEARRWAGEAVAVSERAGVPMWLARALADHGRLLAGSPDAQERAQADAVLGRAFAVATEANCQPVLRLLSGPERPWRRD